MYALMLFALGVFSGELTLSDLTPLGTWTIQVNTNVSRPIW